ncbi:protein of unknown function [Pararobbsia alpina]
MAVLYHERMFHRDTIFAVIDAVKSTEAKKVL